MLAIEIELLTGRYVATSSANYSRAEWPPHPCRLFSALVATHHEHGSDDETRRALEWLERQPPPGLYVSKNRAVRHERNRWDDERPPTVFVPVNDDSARDLAEKGKTKKRRTFPTVIPDERSLYFVWTDTDEDEVAHRPALDELTAQLAYLGHSSSLVRARILEPGDRLPVPNLAPSPEGRVQLRVPTDGRFETLEALYAQGRRPTPSISTQYQWLNQTKSDIEFTSTCFDEFLVYARTDGPTPPIEGAYRLTSTVHRALTALADEPVAPVISGHSADGSPLERDHVAIVPLANVGHGWADGRILGFALILPRRIDADERRAIYRAAQPLDHVALGKAGKMKIERVTVPNLRTLRPNQYRKRSKRWATITPYVFDYFPNEGTGKDRETIVSNACERIGLPVPEKIGILNATRHLGVPPADRFQVGKRAHFRKRPRRHLELEFDEPVQGPVLLGAGRYYGFGLCLPLPSRNEDEESR